MGNIKLRKQSIAQTPIPALDQMSLFVDVADDILKTMDSSGNVRPQGVGTADELATSGGPVDVSASDPPMAGQFLVATSGTTAAWATVETGPATQLSTTGAPVTIENAGPPAQGQVLIATSATNAVWGNLKMTPTAVVSNTTYQAAVGNVVRCNVAAGNVTVVLPSAHSTGDQVTVKMVSAANGVLEVRPFLPTENIDGDKVLSIGTDFEWAVLMSDGTNWMQVG
jgi:hypothetical protein